MGSAPSTNSGNHGGHFDTSDIVVIVIAAAIPTCCAVLYVANCCMVMKEEVQNVHEQRNQRDSRDERRQKRPNPVRNQPPVTMERDSLINTNGTNDGTRAEQGSSDQSNQTSTRVSGDQASSSSKESPSAKARRGRVRPNSTVQEVDRGSESKLSETGENTSPSDQKSGSPRDHTRSTSPDDTETPDEIAVEKNSQESGEQASHSKNALSSRHDRRYVDRLETITRPPRVSRSTEIGNMERLLFALPRVVCSSMDERACVICLNPISNTVATMGVCRHLMHLTCLQPWLETSTSETCPICKTPLVDDSQT